MKRISKSQMAKIAEINALIPVLEHNVVFTYDGGTWPYIVDIKPIAVSANGQFVTIEPTNGSAKTAVGSFYISSKERFNVNDSDYYSMNGAKALNHTLSTILKAFKKSI